MEIFLTWPFNYQPNPLSGPAALRRGNNLP
jgi:hypothetical protein